MPSYILTQNELNSTNVSSTLDPNNYTVYKYNHPVSPDFYKYRSIIAMGPSVVCFSPPKSMTYSEFCDTHSDKNIVSEEFVEGTMVNVFWDGNDWRKTTKSKMDAKCVFFDTNGEFCQLFEDALQSANLDLNVLNKSYCYSFVMQHPRNRLVTAFTEIKLYLISAYYIENSSVDTTVTTIDAIRSDPMWESTRVQFPAVLDWDLRKPIENMPYTMMGVSFKEPISGDRCKLRNPAFEYVRHLRGNQPKLSYRYLELRKMGKVVEFLKFYPEHSNQFRHYQTNLHQYTNNLYNMYVNIFIKKLVQLDQVHRIPYQISLKQLHYHYRTILVPQNKFVTLQTVIEYINGLPEAILMGFIR
jgi:hypothetical protein